MADDVCAALLAALRRTEWPAQSDRPKVESGSYLVLESADKGRARAKRERHGEVWAAVARWMAGLDPAFAYTGVALTKGFRGSPHVDTYDISYQWATSLGDFEGGELCVEAAVDEVRVVTTKGRAAKVDGRYPHWVAPWRGDERYSVIVYQTRGEGTRKGPAVYIA